MSLPSTGISLVRVSNELNDITMPLSLAHLCKSNSINKFSVRKPMDISETERKLYSSLAWDEMCYQHDLGLYGFSGDTGQLYTIAYNNNGDWNYKKPTGGASSPYHIGDFRGYSHTAQQPMTFTISKNPNLNTMRIRASHGGEIDFSRMSFWNNAKFLESYHFSPSDWKYAVVDNRGGITLSNNDNVGFPVTGGTMDITNYQLNEGHNYGCIIMLPAKYNQSQSYWEYSEIGVFLPHTLFDYNYDPLEGSVKLLSVSFTPTTSYDMLTYVTTTVRAINQNTQALSYGEIVCEITNYYDNQEPPIDWSGSAEYPMDSFSASGKILSGNETKIFSDTFSTSGIDVDDFYYSRCWIRVKFRLGYGYERNEIYWDFRANKTVSQMPRWYKM